MHHVHECELRLSMLEVQQQGLRVRPPGNGRMQMRAGLRMREAMRLQRVRLLQHRSLIR